MIIEEFLSMVINLKLKIGDISHQRILKILHRIVMRLLNRPKVEMLRRKIKYYFEEDEHGDVC